MRNVLVTVLGLSPAVVTETLWALAYETTRQRRARPFLVEEIHYLTTLDGKTKLERLGLFAPGGVLDRLCCDWGLPRPRVVPHLVVHPERGELDDIRDESDNVALADNALRLIADLTAEDACRVHASLAGGRKTMSYFIGYAMTLLARAEDQLSHVLVDPDYEVDGFWYPAPRPQPVEVTRFDPGRGERTTRTLDFSQARVDLALIPFVRLRYSFEEKDRQRLQRWSFADLVRAIHATLRPPHVVLHDRRQAIEANGWPVALADQHYVMYRLLAEVRLEERPGAGPGGIGPEHAGWLTAKDFAARGGMVERYLRLYREIAAIESTRVEEFEERLRLDELKGGDTMERTFSGIRSKLDDQLEAALPPTLKRLHELGGKGTRPSRFGLQPEPEQIEIVSRSG